MNYVFRDMLKPRGMFSLSFCIVKSRLWVSAQKSPNSVFDPPGDACYKNLVLGFCPEIAWQQ